MLLRDYLQRRNGYVSHVRFHVLEYYSIRIYVNIGLPKSNIYDNYNISFTLSRGDKFIGRKKPKKISLKNTVFSYI